MKFVMTYAGTKPRGLHHLQERRMKFQTSYADDEVGEDCVERAQNEICDDLRRGEAPRTASQISFKLPIKDYLRVI